MRIAQTGGAFLIGKEVPDLSILKSSKADNQEHKI
jgi:hypothetical protein